MKKTVLILGNGVSRLEFNDRILAFDGEVWACNYAFREFSAKISRLYGHKDPMLEAQDWKEKHDLKYEIYSGPINKQRPDWREITVPPKWRKDSGTTLVCQALFEGFDVICCGMDLGGPDVYDPAAFKKDKTNWVRRWTEIITEWDPARITFWGHDHMPFLQGIRNKTRQAREYARQYLRRKPHIPGVYINSWREAVFVKKNIDPVEEEIVQVKWKINGLKAPMKRKVARIYEARGAIVILEPEPVSAKVAAVPVPRLEPVAVQEPKHAPIYAAPDFAADAKPAKNPRRKSKKEPV